MKESYECEIATHIGPESCGAAREGGVEALTGERAGRVYSRERTFLRDADAVGESGRLHPVHRYREVYGSPARSQTPVHVRRHLAREPGDPKSAQSSSCCGTHREV
jgi:hypothetical protein